MKKLLLCGVVGAVIASPAMARRVEPGLWESAITRHGPEAEARRKISEKTRAMLKAQGLEMDGGTVKTKICISKEIADADKSPLPTMKECKVLKAVFVGNTYVVDTECTIMGVASRGHSEVTYENLHHYYGTITTDSVRNGTPHHSLTSVEGHFISADCGTVKPMLTK